MKERSYRTTLGVHEIVAMFSDLADQTNGSAMVRSGGTTVLATAVMGKKERADIDYFPLTVDYEEKFYAAGLVLGGRFLRREGRPSEEAILNGRIVDRTIRPLFDQSFRHDVQVIITVLSIDSEHDPDILAILAASLALATSNIPWRGPLGAVRIGKKDAVSNLSVNPLYADRKDAVLDTVICGKDGDMNMIEAFAREVDEDVLAEAFERAVAEIKTLEEFQKKIVSEIGKKKISFEKKEVSETTKKLFAERIGEQELKKAIFGNPEHSKEVFVNIEFNWKELCKETLSEEGAARAEEFLHEEIDRIVHDEALINERRPDGRALDEVRPLFARAGEFLECLHGTGLFYRGGTHVLSILTLGSPEDSQIVEGMEVRTKKYFMHHYNFPPFSSGETGRMGGANRRAIGHGALAEKALR